MQTLLLYKFDQKLFRRSTRNACKSQLTDGQFADDAVLLTTTRSAAEQAMMSYIDVTRAFDLTVSIQKTRLMATRPNITEVEKAPIHVGTGMLKCWAV